jgi:hypothetical protein
MMISVIIMKKKWRYKTMNIAVPLVVIAVTLIGGIAAIFLLNPARKKKTHTINRQQQTANEIINVRDIRDKYLYTRNNHIMMYIRINPISVDLLSDREKKTLTGSLTAELSGEQKPFKFIAVSRPVDISPLINEYRQLISDTSNQKRKELLRNEMLVMSNYALSGEVVERQFYIVIWECYEEGIEREISKRCLELVSKFEGSGISCEVLKQQDIVKLCNLFNNPAYIHMEDSSFDAAIPILENLYEEEKG